MKSTQRSFSEEFIKEAVKLSQTSDQSLKEVAKSLDVGVSTLSRWRQQASNKPAHKSAGKAKRHHTSESDVENIRLKRENERLKKENEILKKAAAFFASEQW